MPAAQRRFDPAAVAQWLEQTGRARRDCPASPADAVAVTRSDAVQMLAERGLPVSVRTLAEWLTDPTFPGKAGTSGRRDGYFPIGAIVAWHAATKAGDQRSQQTDEVLAEARRNKAQTDSDQAQLELEQALGTLLDAGDVERFLRRQVATAKALLDELPDKVASRLPAKLDPKVRKAIRQAEEEVIQETLNAIAELAAGDQDEVEEEDADADDS